jgi:hypothetical protein
MARALVPETGVRFPGAIFISQLSYLDTFVLSNVLFTAPDEDGGIFMVKDGEELTRK